MYGGTKQGLSLDDVKNYVILLPSREIQNDITNWIDVSTRRISDSIASIENEIALLQEFRTRLIADVVTGKLDIREAAASLPERADGPEPLGEAEGPDEFQDTEGEDSEFEEAAA